MELLKELNRLNNLQYAVVAFSRGTDVNAYCFMTTTEDLQEGDMLVVKTKDGFCIAYFYEYTEEPNDIRRATNWIVQKIDTKEFEANVAAFAERSNT